MGEIARSCAVHPEMNRECQDCKRAYRKWHYQQNKAWYKERHSEWYQKNKAMHNEKQFSRHVKESYGLTLTEYREFIAAHPTCDICGVNFKHTKACLDHNHFTGKLRGVLCSKCNMALGLFDDELIRLQQAQNYLEKHELADD